MELFNYVIIGSGPAGISAAKILEHHGACLVDAGDLPEQSFAHASLTSALSSDNTLSLLGDGYEMLANIVNPLSTHTKLRAKGLRHVLKGQRFKLKYDTNSWLKCAGSYAAGGMSNAWGAQLLRYTQRDLADAGNWPINIERLNPYYSSLEADIGIAGCNDDMQEFLGAVECLLPATPIGPAADYLLRRYNNNRHAANSFKLGRARLAVLTQQHNEYEKYHFGETEFFTTEHTGIYTARRTLNELLNRRHITYFGRHELISYHEHPEFVQLEIKDRDSQETHTLKAKHLLLGCGAVQTARLVLLNKKQFGYKLPFIDHPPTLIPFFLPRMFGSAISLNSYPIQLIATMNRESAREMVSFYYPGGLLWSDLLPEIPLPLPIAIKILKNLIGGMLVAQIWETSKVSVQNYLMLNSEKDLVIHYPDRQKYSNSRELLRSMSSLGAYSLQRFVSSSPPGFGFHHAGCLPMRSNPKPYETNIDGTLWGSPRVRIIDASVFPSLPSKNHSLTIMANAARIADEVLKCGY